MRRPNFTNCFSHQFSSVQDGIYVLRKGHMCSTLCFRSFPNVAFETVFNVCLTDNGALLSFQERLSSTSSFHTSFHTSLYVCFSLPGPRMWSDWPRSSTRVAARPARCWWRWEPRPWKHHTSLNCWMSFTWRMCCRSWWSLVSPG